MHLSLQDFKTITEYNSILFQISSRLKLCREKITEKDMLEKKFTTFHALNVLLQKQYRERRFIKYSKIISCLLIVEQNNELLMKNHKSRPIGFESFPKVNAISSHKRRLGRRCGHDRGCGKNSQYHFYDNNPSNSQKMKASFHP